MKNIKFIIIGLFALLSVGLVLSAIEPGAPLTMTNDGSWTNGGGGAGGHPMMLNNTRGYIYEYIIDDSFQTNRWRAYVGNVTGELQLGDGTYDILDWSLTHVTGELYATRMNGSTDQGTSGTIMWENVVCANASQLNNETTTLNHDDDIDVDALNLTFTQLGSFTDFEVAGNNIDTSDCYGTYLYNSSGETSTSTWQQVALQDTGDSLTTDLFYAVMLENNALGFNGETYDFQIIIPDQGSETDSDNIAYYFYIELIGNT